MEGVPCPLRSHVLCAGTYNDRASSALAPGPVQEMLVHLLPGILGRLTALIFPAQQRDEGARFHAYRGTGLLFASVCMLA